MNIKIIIIYIIITYLIIALSSDTILPLFIPVHPRETNWMNVYFNLKDDNNCINRYPAYIKINQKEKTISVEQDFIVPECKFTKLYLNINIKSMNDYYINTSMHIDTINRTGDNLYIIMDRGKLETGGSSPINFYATINKDFFNYYDIIVDGNIQRFNLIYDTSLIRGYLCDFCISVIEPRSSEGIKRFDDIPYDQGKYNEITYEFENTRRLLFSFNPKDRLRLFIESFIYDLAFVILGIILGILWKKDIKSDKIIKPPKPKNNKQFRKKK